MIKKVIMKNITIKLFCVAFVMTMSQGLLQAQRDLKSSLFDEVNQSMWTAKRAQADVLSPRAFGDAMDDYNDAKKKFDDGGDLSDIRAKITKADGQFQEATVSTRVSSVLFSSALSARRDAISAEADQFVKERWNTAEEEMKDAAEKLEKGNSNSAKEKAVVATNLYREAELESIKANYLTNAKNLLKKADGDKVYKVAPKTIAEAKSLVSRAEKELLDNRYDTDGARYLAKEAEYKARLAMYIAAQENILDKKDFETEDFLLMSNESITRIGESLDINSRFDKGEAIPVSAIIERIHRDQARTENLEASLYGQQMKNQNLTAMLVEQQKIQATMQGSLTAMKGTISEEALKGQARQLELQSRIDRMEDINTKFEQMQRIFSSEEAQVFRQENDVIIRMIGINFDVSKSEIKPEDYPLLTKVKKAMDLFDNASIVIEGHTDSQGGDDSNLKLSQERADAVLSYLSANTTIDKSRFSTEGFGESKPVANNETTAGRKLNRRIDIVIKPTYSDIATPMLGSLKE